jgi:hypothetical protein
MACRVLPQLVRPRLSGLFTRSPLPDWERFLQFVVVPPDSMKLLPSLPIPQDFTLTTAPCWEFVGGLTSSGHGNFRIWDPIRGWRNVSAHKFSYLHFKGALPTGADGLDMHVRHVCDWKPCVAPYHLIPGTRSQNMKDMIERGRGRKQFGSDDPPF